MLSLRIPEIAAILITAQADDPTGLMLEDLVTTVYLNHVGPGVGVLRHTITNLFCLRIAVIRRTYASHDSCNREPLL